jgi:NAD(P)-dependent dehydrogenase (short-subunit alcohol dehydrogenase family)
MGALEGRVAIITGAGRGIGREHALLYAKEGAKVVVNDLGGAADGSGADRTPAQEVVEEITAAGGTAIASADDVADEAGADQLIASALDAFGELHVVVNNAGILRDRVLVNMTTDEWDAVMRVHLRGHFLPTRAAARYWRARSKEGHDVRASVINTSSTSGLIGNAGQTNYGAAKSGIASFTIIAQMELVRYGVRLNAIAPAARTRLTLQVAGMDEAMKPPEEGFDKHNPANISPLVAYLGTEGCRIQGKVFFIFGSQIHLIQPWTLVDKITSDDRWTIAELAEAADRFADVSFDLGMPSFA